ncbi:hypothetical protein F5X96DRAFT_431250 [Biscogniauxia mediterranea]|nr:hypothetical protein F5X96DRAFT_431250 [Biscogniauxia mediterranea]
MWTFTLTVIQLNAYAELSRVAILWFSTSIAITATFSVKQTANSLQYITSDLGDVPINHQKMGTYLFNTIKAMSGGVAVHALQGCTHTFSTPYSNATHSCR